MIMNAIIKSAEITTNAHGLLTAWVHLDFGGSGQGFGGYCLYLPKSFDHHQLNSPAGHFIFRVIEIAGVEKWADVVGKAIRVRKEKDEWGEIEAIGHIIKEDWFSPDDDFAELRTNTNERKLEKPEFPGGVR